MTARSLFADLTRSELIELISRLVSAERKFGDEYAYLKDFDPVVREWVYGIKDPARWHDCWEDMVWVYPDLVREVELRACPGHA